jgi:ElaB/YqjD/DUF883 family membrane-anchored ribosome-binding protein
MNAVTLSRAKNQARDGVSDAADRLRDISEAIAERCLDGYRDAERSVRRLRIAAEESVDDTRKRIKAHPIAAVALVAAGAFVVGGLVGRGAHRRGWR